MGLSYPLAVYNSSGGSGRLHGKQTVPGTITTDQGTQFTGSTWQCMCKALGSKHVRTTVLPTTPSQMAL